MISNLNDKNNICPIDYALNAIGGKWKMLILYKLMTEKVVRYGELKKSISGINHKMLSCQLKDLESYEIIHRIVYNEIPPKVEYSLSEKGISLLPILELMYKWGEENINNSNKYK